MKYRLTVVLLFAALLFSCNSMKEKPPIADDKMEQLLIDLQMAEVYSSITRDSVNNVTTKNMDTLAAYHKDILKHHNLTQEQFHTIVTWYKDHSEKLDSIYTRVLPRMTELESRYTITH